MNEKNLYYKNFSFIYSFISSHMTIDASLYTHTHKYRIFSFITSSRIVVVAHLISLWYYIVVVVSADSPRPTTTTTTDAAATHDRRVDKHKL
jgi:hypothetical protein